MTSVSCTNTPTVLPRATSRHRRRMLTGHKAPMDQNSFSFKFTKRYRAEAVTWWRTSLAADGIGWDGQVAPGWAPGVCTRSIHASGYKDPTEARVVLLTHTYTRPGSRCRQSHPPVTRSTEGPRATEARLGDTWGWAIGTTARCQPDAFAKHASRSGT